MSVPERSKASQYLRKAIKSAVVKNKKGFQFLSDKKNHWEKWFQVELGTEIDAAEAHYDVELETQIVYDKRYSNTVGRTKEQYETGNVDLTYRCKRSKGKARIAIELKQNKDFGQCFNGMLEDVTKIRAIKGSSWNFRSVYFVFFSIKGHKEGKLKKAWINIKKSMPESCFDIETCIPDLQVSVLFWESKSLISKMSQDQYVKWYENLIHIYPALRELRIGKPKKKEKQQETENN